MQDHRPNRSLKTALAVACCVVSVALMQTAMAQTAEKVRVDIPAQDLSAALAQFGRETGTEIAFAPDAVRQKRATAVKGEFERNEILQLLLQGSGLTYRVTAQGAIVIEAPKASADSMQGAGMRLAQTSSPSHEERKDEENTQTVSSSSSEVGEGLVQAIPEVLIKGSKILNTDIRRSDDDIQPYVIFDRERIERSSAANLEEFFKNELTMNMSVARSVQSEGRGNKSNINLRGLGADETLILIDGRRAAGFNFEGSPNQPDINGIPLAAVERIEVLPTTASGIFGGGATGGVINIVLRRDYSGLETQLTYGNSFESDTADRRVDVSAGFSLEGGRTNVMLSGSYSDANPLFARERDLIQRGHQRILDSTSGDLHALNPFGGPPLGATTNILSADGTDLTLDNGTELNSPITFVPKGYAGATTDGGAALTANAGRYNLELSETAQQGGGRYGLLGTPEMKSLMLTVRREFMPRLQAFLELKASESSTDFSFNFANLTTTIDADAPNNPFQQAISVTVPTVGMDETFASDAEDRRAVVGIIAQLPGQWQATLDFTWSRSRSSYVVARGLTDASIVGASSGALDVLRDLNQFPIAWESYDPSAQSPGDMELRNTALRVGGELPWALPGGKPVLSSLIEYREEAIGDVIQICGGPCSAPAFFYPSRSQSVSSTYVEGRLPMVSAVNRKLGIELLELQIAVRGDKYRITGANAPLDLAALPPIERTTGRNSSVDPTVGFRYQPVRDLTLRASYGSGYKPPAMSQLAPQPVFPLNLAFTRARDPLRGNESLGTVQWTQGGNPNLRPEQSESWAVGIILAPRGVPGLRVAADWSSIEKLDNIASSSFSFGSRAQSSLETLINFFPERVTRGAPSDGFSVGRIIGIDATAINIAKLRVEAGDLAIDYTLETDRFGVIDISADATRLISLQTQAAPGAAVIENLGGPTSDPTATFQSLKWKANASLNWAYKGWDLGWRARFFDSYFLNLAHTVNARQGSASVPHQMYHDLYGAYRFPASDLSASSLLADTQIRFGVNNVFNKEPPVDVVNNIFLMYSYLGDPRLANYYVSISKSFGR